MKLGSQVSVCTTWYRGGGDLPSVNRGGVAEERLEALELLNTGHLTTSNTPVYGTISPVLPSY